MFRPVWALALLGIWLASGQSCLGGQALRAHPRLLLSAGGIARLKQLIRQVPHARKAFERIKSEVDKSLDRPVELPERGSNWYHWYVCPKHGTRLTTGRQLSKWQWEHICPVDRQVFLGDPSRVETDFDGCRLQAEHQLNAMLVRNAGLLFRLTDNQRYMAKARDLLLAYAQEYARYPLHNTRGQAAIGGGKVGSQTLDESTWLIPAVQGADLIWDRISENDRRQIAEKLFLPAVREVILPHRMGVHNIQCWKNSAVGLVGILLDDPELIRAAIDDPASGFRTQIAKGVQDDGLWWENAWGYHFYTLSALWPLTEAARNCGIDLYDLRLKRMFDAPLNLAMPDLVLPDFNDSHPVSLAGRATIYELAYARYRDDRYLPLLRQSARTDEMALCYGVQELPDAQLQAPPGPDHKPSGYAILTAGNGPQATWLCMKYGPHGGGHGHPDKLGFILYARGQVLAPDAGITAYGTPLHSSWYRTTLAHNTLVVDQQDQRPATGRCLALASEADVQYAMADAGGIYEGLTFVRTVAMIGADDVLVFDHIRADRPRMLDIAYHQRGTLPSGRENAPWSIPGTRGYQHLADATIQQAEAGASLVLPVRNDWNTRLTLAGGAPTSLIIATGIGTSTADRVPVVIFRRNAQDTVMVWSVCLTGRDTHLRALPVTDADGHTPPASKTAAVSWSSGQKTLCLVSNPSGKPVTVGLPDGTTWRTDRLVAVR